MIFLVYNLVLLLCLPLILLYLFYRIVVSKKSSKAWREQLGFTRVSKEISQNKPIWIHAVSVGESVASASVVSEIKKVLPDIKILISTTTQSGRRQAEKTITNADVFVYYPFDLLLSVCMSIRAVNPQVFASTDTEIWPNFRWALKKAGVKSALINGTISERTLNGARKLPWLYRWTLSNMDLFCMQSQEDADRIISIGANPDKVVVTGNIKWDQALLELENLDVAELRLKYLITENTPLFVAGSTNPGEDEPVIGAFMKCRQYFPRLRLVIAPRQIERRTEIVELAAKKNLRCSWRSEPATVTGEEDILILDTFGELAKIYALADVTFVGGSLIPRGCHSILQPIALGKPVFYGPHTFKARDVTAQAERAEVGFRINSAEEMAQQIISLLSDPTGLNEIESKCRQLVKANHGAAAKTAELLLS